MSANFSLVAPPDFIDELAALKELEGVRLGRPQPASTLIDAADAPLGPELIGPVLAAITAICATAGGIVVLVDQIFTLVEKRRKKTAATRPPEDATFEIIILDPVSSRELVRIKSTSTKEAVVKTLTKD